jgi:hypothetical protein
MQDFDFNTEIPLGPNRDLLTEQKQAGISNLLADAYGWAADNKLAAAAAVGLAAASAYALLRGGIGNAAKASSSEALGVGQKFVVQDASVLGGKIGVNASERFSPGVAAAIAEGRPIVGTSITSLESLITNGQRTAASAGKNSAEFVVAEGGELGGRIMAKPIAAASDDAFAMGQRALSSPLHEIPSFEPTLRGDFLPKSAVRVIDNFEARTGLKLLGK